MIPGTGAVLGTWGEARLGAMWRNVDAETDTGPAVPPGVKETSAGPRALLYVDRLDHAWFPHQGFRAVGSAYVADEGFGSDHNYKRLEGQLLGAISFGPHTLNAAVEGGTN
jgi:NTE family protein